MKLASLLKPFRIAAAACALLGAGATQAAPIIGASLYWGGGDITVTVFPASAGYTSELGIYDASRNLMIDLNLFNYQAGSSVLVTAAQMAANGYVAGSEVIFGINVLNTGHTFVMGDGSRNADGIAHAAVDAQGNGQYQVGFEDLYGGGDLDYNDNIFMMVSGLTDNKTPLPGSLALLGIGLLALSLRRSS